MVTRAKVNRQPVPVPLVEHVQAVAGGAGEDHRLARTGQRGAVPVHFDAITNALANGLDQPAEQADIQIHPTLAGPFRGEHDLGHQDAGIGHQ